MTPLGIVLFVLGLVSVLAVPTDLRWGNPRAALLCATLGAVFLMAALYCFGVLTGQAPASP